MEASIAVSLIASLSAVVVALISGWFSYKTNQKIDELEDKVQDLEADNCKQKKVLRNLRGYLKSCLYGIDKLIGQIVTLGHEPVWRPEQPPDGFDDEDM